MTAYATPGRAATMKAPDMSFEDARSQLAAYDRQTPCFSTPGDWVGASYTARRCGIDAEVIVGFSLWTVIQAGHLQLKDVMMALAAAGAATGGVTHSIELGTVPQAVAFCVGDQGGRPILAIKLGA